MATRYVDKCATTITFKNSDQLKQLYSLAQRNKIDAVNFYLDSHTVFVAFESYLTSAAVVSPLDCTIREIMVKDTENNIYSTNIDNQKYNEEYQPSEDVPPSQAKITRKPSLLPEETVFNIENKTYIRFSVVTSFLRALSFYTKRPVIISANDENITLYDSSTQLSFPRVLTLSDLSDYLTPFTGHIWDTISTIDVSKVVNIMARTKDTVYKSYVAIQDKKVFSHNTSFIVEKPTTKLSTDYLFPYITLDALRTLKSTSNKANITKSKDALYIYCNGIYVNWGINNIQEEVVNLLIYLNEENLVRLCKVSNSEWGKLTMLKDYSTVDTDQDVTIRIAEKKMWIMKEDNRAEIDTSDIPENMNIEFKVGIDTLQTASKLFDESTDLYIDSTGKESVLILHNDVTVAISSTDIKIANIGDHPVYMKQPSTTKINQSTPAPDDLDFSSTKVVIDGMEELGEVSTQGVPDDIDMYEGTPFDYTEEEKKLMRDDNPLTSKLGTIPILPAGITPPKRGDE